MATWSTPQWVGWAVLSAPFIAVWVGWVIRAHRKRHWWPDPHAVSPSWLREQSRKESYEQA